MALFHTLPAEDKTFAQKLEAPFAPDAGTKAYTLKFKNPAPEEELVARGNRVKVTALRLTNPPDSRWGPPHFPEKTQKRFIVLHFTAGGIRGSVGNLTWDRKFYGKTVVSTPYVVARDGTIYQLHDDEYWAHHASNGKADRHSIGIELINHGFLVPDGNRLLTSAKAHYCDLSDSEAYHRLEQPWRGFHYYATHTDAQYDATQRLLAYLCARHDIPYEFQPEDRRYEHFWKGGAVAPGIYSHINFIGKSKDTGAYSKWDLGPAFEWDRLLPRPALCMPMDYKGHLAKEDADFYRDPDELRVTRSLIDGAYTHTEKDFRGGYFPLGVNTTWHGGVHLHATEGDPVQPVISCAPGEVLAVRLEKNDAGKGPYLGSRNFILMRHTLDKPAIQDMPSLHVPVSYVIRKTGVTFQGVGGVPPLAPGDVLERTDPEAARDPAVKRCPVKIVSFNDDIARLDGYTVTDDGLKLTRDEKGEQTTLALLPGDRVHLIKPADRQAGEPEPASPAKVRLTALAEGFLDVFAWRVIPRDYTNFRREPGEGPDVDPATRLDRARLFDLAGGDIIEKVDHADKGRDGPTKSARWHKVKVVRLAEDRKAVTGYTITARTLSVRDDASQADDKRLIALRKGDKVSLLQKHSASSGSGKNRRRYDLIAITSLTGQDVASYTVQGAKKTLHDAKGGAVIRELAAGDTLTVTGMHRKVGEAVWAPVQVGAGEPAEGWVRVDGKLKADMQDRAGIPWCADLLGKPYYVDSDAAYGAEVTAEREIPEEAGWVLVPDPALAAHDGIKRQEHYAPLLTKPKQTDVPEDKIFYLKLDAASLAEHGETRAQRFAKLVGTAGVLKFEPDRMTVRTKVPDEVLAGLENKPYHALYMHLSDQENLSASNATLEKYEWIPRLHAKYTLKAAAALWADDGKTRFLMPLAEKDELEVLDQPRPGDRLARIRIAKLEAGDVTRSLTVKSPAVLTEDDPDKEDKDRSAEPSMTLRVGDVLTPDAIEAAGEPRQVRLKSLAAGECDVSYRITGGLKSLYSLPDAKAGKQLMPLRKDDVLRAIAPGESGDPRWSYVEVTSVSDAGKPDDRRKTGLRGWIALDKRTSATKGQRTEVYGALIGQPGLAPWDPKLYTEEKAPRAQVYSSIKEGWIEYTPLVMDTKPKLDPAFFDSLKGGAVMHLGTKAADGKVSYPTLPAGAPLWKSGVFGEEESKDAIAKRQPRIHWEIFSEENLTRFHRKTWSEAVDDVDDYNLDNPEIIKTIRDALDARAAGLGDKVLGKDELLDADEIVGFYSGKDGAERMRRFACKFLIEWAMDVDAAVERLKKKPFFTGRLKNGIRPQLWWDQALKAKVPLPPAKNYHYNPIAFLETLSEGELERQAAAKPAAAAGQAGTAATEKSHEALPDVTEVWFAPEPTSWDKLPWEEVIRGTVTVVAKLAAAVPASIKDPVYQAEVFTEHGRSVVLDLTELSDDRTQIRGTLDAETVQVDLRTHAPDGSYVSSDMGDAVDSDAFEAAMKTAGFGPGLTGARKSGTEGQTPAANSSFLVAGGAQKLTARHDPDGVSSKHKEISCTRLLKYEASYFYHSGHGKHATGKLELADGWHGVEAAATPWWSGMKACIIAGCSVLDIYGHNIHDVDEFFTSGASAFDDDPGELWVRTGAAKYLGYGSSGPADAGGVPAKVITEWVQKLGAGTGTPREWVEINLAARATAAVAIDAQSSQYCWVRGLKAVAHVAEATF